MTQPGMTPPPVMAHPDVRPFSFTASDEALADGRERLHVCSSEHGRWLDTHSEDLTGA
jgi:hypothetical protein